MIEEISHIEDRDKLLNFINNNDDFWKMVDYIDWYNLTNFGKNDNHIEYMNNAKNKLNEFIKRRLRKEKLNVIYNLYSDFDENTLKEYYHSVYRVLLKSIYSVYEKEFLSGDLNISDDGYWDLRSSIIGYGKEFLLNSFNNKELIISISKNRNFCENFGYIFNL